MTAHTRELKTTGLKQNLIFLFIRRSQRRAEVAGTPGTRASSTFPCHHSVPGLHPDLTVTGKPLELGSSWQREGGRGEGRRSGTCSGVGLLEEFSWEPHAARLRVSPRAARRLRAVSPAREAGRWQSFSGVTVTQDNMGVLLPKKEQLGAGWQ